MNKNTLKPPLTRLEFPNLPSQLISKNNKNFVANFQVSNCSV